MIIVYIFTYYIDKNAELSSLYKCFLIYLKSIHFNRIISYFVRIQIMKYIEYDFTLVSKVN